MIYSVHCITCVGRLENVICSQTITLHDLRNVSQPYKKTINITIDVHISFLRAQIVEATNNISSSQDVHMTRRI